MERNGQNRFDAYEIAVCGAAPSDDGGEIVESFETAVEAQEYAEAWSGRIFWTLYGHRSGQGAEAIVDCVTQEEALDLLYSITGIDLPPSDARIIHRIN